MEDHCAVNTYLSEFIPVSIKMAKEQNLSLESDKDFRNYAEDLMCCLKNEQEAYEHLNSNLPNVGETVKTFDGFKGEVYKCQRFKTDRLKVVIEQNDEREIREYSVNELKV